MVKDTATVAASFPVFLLNWPTGPRDRVQRAMADKTAIDGLYMYWHPLSAPRLGINYKDRLEVEGRRLKPYLPLACPLVSLCLSL